MLGGTGYEMRGLVEVGAGRGHALGFPTANVRAPAKLLPKDGVYAAMARYDGRDYAALVSIGTQPAVRRDDSVRSRHGCGISSRRSTVANCALRDLRYVREQRLFADAGELVEQMQRDLEAVAYPSYG